MRHLSVSSFLFLHILNYVEIFMAKKLLTKSEVITDISTKINDEVEQGITGKKLAGVLTNMVNYSEDASQILLSSGSAEHS